MSINSILIFQHPGYVQRLVKNRQNQTFDCLHAPSVSPPSCNPKTVPQQIEAGLKSGAKIRHTMTYCTPVSSLSRALVFLKMVDSGDSDYLLHGCRCLEGDQPNRPHFHCPCIALFVTIELCPS